MALSARQNRLYQHLCDLYELTTPFNTDGVALSPQWTRIAEGVRCHFQLRANLDEPAVLGRAQMDNALVLDVLHLDERQNVASDMMVLNRTLDPDGSPSENYGLCWVVRGPARSISQRPGRHFQKKSVFLYLEPNPPADILADV